MKKENVVNTFFLTRKELKDMSLLNSILDMNLDVYSVYRLEINLLPINYYLGFGSCNSDLLSGLICLQRNEFYFDGDIEILYGVISSTIEIPVGQGRGYLLYGDGVVCHDMFIATLARISR